MRLLNMSEEHQYLSVNDVGLVGVRETERFEGLGGSPHVTQTMESRYYLTHQTRHS